ncbi:MAG: hypothetical protein ACLR78_03120 [Roseburia sp.]
MRKAIAGVLMGAAVLSLAACGKKRHRADNSGAGCRECRQHSGSG